jgi:hypothetical protein
MNNSTENVTLYATFILDILEVHADKKVEYKELFEMASDLDLSHHFNLVPMQVYNDMCDWIEEKLGKFNLIRVGKKIGETVHQNLLSLNIISDNAMPSDIVMGLKYAAATMIQDPLNRGWDIVKNEDKNIILRRTQTFNSYLQLGILDTLLRKSPVKNVKVDYFQRIADGAEFDEYLITWE